jgi:hypothetical protein
LWAFVAAWHAIKLRRKALVAGSKAIESLSEAERAFARHREAGNCKGLWR